MNQRRRLAALSEHMESRLVLSPVVFMPTSRPAVDNVDDAGDVLVVDQPQRVDVPDDGEASGSSGRTGNSGRGPAEVSRTTEVVEPTTTSQSTAMRQTTQTEPAALENSSTPAQPADQRSREGTAATEPNATVADEPASHNTAEQRAADTPAQQQESETPTEAPIVQPEQPTVASEEPVREEQQPTRSSADQTSTTDSTQQPSRETAAPDVAAEDWNSSETTSESQTETDQTATTGTTSSEQTRSTDQPAMTSKSEQPDVRPHTMETTDSPPADSSTGSETNSVGAAEPRPDSVVATDANNTPESRAEEESVAVEPESRTETRSKRSPQVQTAADAETDHNAGTVQASEERTTSTDERRPVTTTQTSPEADESSTRPVDEDIDRPETKGDGSTIRSASTVSESRAATAVDAGNGAAVSVTDSSTDHRNIRVSVAANTVRPVTLETETVRTDTETRDEATELTAEATTTVATNDDKADDSGAVTDSLESTASEVRPANDAASLPPAIGTTDSDVQYSRPGDVEHRHTPVDQPVNFTDSATTLRGIDTGSTDLQYTAFPSASATADERTLSSDGLLFSSVHPVSDNAASQTVFGDATRLGLMLAAINHAGRRSGSLIAFSDRADEAGNEGSYYSKERRRRRAPTGRRMPTAFDSLRRATNLLETIDERASIPCAAPSCDALFADADMMSVLFRETEEDGATGAAANGVLLGGLLLGTAGLALSKAGQFRSRRTGNVRPRPAAPRYSGRTLVFAD